MTLRHMYGMTLIAALLLLSGVQAFAQDQPWIVRGMTSYSATASDRSPVTTTQAPPIGVETITQDVSGGPGFGFGFEYLLTERIGIEGAAFLTFHDVDMTISNDTGTFRAMDTTRFRTFTLGANYYFDIEGRLRWSLGGFVPLMFADGTSHVFTGPGRTEGRAYDQDYGVGLKGGLDWSFADGSPWMLSIEARYMPLLTMESESAGDIDVDPVMLSVGLSYRF